MIDLLYNLICMGDDMPKGALDRPDDKDYYAEHILGYDEGNLPEKIKLKTKADDQGKSVKCTCYASYHAGRILDEIEHNRPLEGLPDVGWEFQKKFGTYNSLGDYVQTALKSIVKNGLHCKDKIYGKIGYAKIKKENIKYWLAKGYPIVTSTAVTKTNYKKAKYEGVWTGIDGEIVNGHAIALIGYEDKYIWALNSFGEKWGFYEDGTFKIPENKTDDLQSCYIIYDEKDVQYIFRDVTNESPFAKSIQWALETELMKGYDSETLPAEKRFFKPEQPVTRGELAEILYRFKAKFY